MRILIVDDILDNIKVAMNHLSVLKCDFIYATSGEQGIERALAHHPDLILMDVMMPGMTGYETVMKMKMMPAIADTPVIFLTAKAEPADIVQGFQCGGSDYITKPFNGMELVARVRIHMELYRHRHELEQLVQERTKEIENLKTAVIEALGSMAEHRDPETGSHIRRTQSYVRALAKRLYEKKSFPEVITDDFINVLFQSAPLHDIGKVGIRDEILLKPSRLNEEEFAEMKRHTLIGEQAIKRLIENAGGCDFLSFALEIAGNHHEKYDGTGYPRGLKNNDIPLSARIMAIADVYDALVNKRAYKEAWTHERAVEMIKEGRGTHFDPVLVDAFLEIADEFSAIHQELGGDE